jgi:hypothetical protein
MAVADPGNGGQRGSAAGLVGIDNGLCIGSAAFLFFLNGFTEASIVSSLLTLINKTLDRGGQLAHLCNVFCRLR